MILINFFSTSPKRDESAEKFVDLFEELDSKNHRISTWFHNTSQPFIHLQFGQFDTTKLFWDFLAHRYTTTNLSHQYQLLQTLHQLRQEPGQSIDDFHSRMQFLWDQLALSEPEWNDHTDAEKLSSY